MMLTLLRYPLWSQGLELARSRESLVKELINPNLEGHILFRVDVVFFFCSETPATRCIRILNHYKYKDGNIDSDKNGVDDNSECSITELGSFLYISHIQV